MIAIDNVLRGCATPCVRLAHSKQGLGGKCGTAFLSLGDVVQVGIFQIPNTHAETFLVVHTELSSRLAASTIDFMFQSCRTMRRAMQKAILGCKRDAILNTESEPHRPFCSSPPMLVETGTFEW